MASEPSVSAGYARGLIELAVAKGVSRDELLARASIEPAALEDLNNRVPFARYVALMRAAKAISGDAALALHFGEAANLAQFSIVGLIGHASETMTEAFRQFNHFVRLVVDVGELPTPPRFAIERRGGGLWLVDRRPNPNDFPELTESAFAQMVCGTRQFGERFVLAAQVTHPDPGYRAEYERIFRAPVTFGAKRNALRFDEAWPTTKVGALPRHVGELLTDRASALLKDMDAARTARGRVEAVLASQLPEGEAGMAAVAARLKISRQTLYRQLRAEGVTFERVLDDLRRRLALASLDAATASVTQISGRLGFSDPAAFSRAFKRWTGVSPRAHRSAARRGG